jgi:hypothetical protein
MRHTMLIDGLMRPVTMSDRPVADHLPGIVYNDLGFVLNKLGRQREALFVFARAI